MPSPAVRWERTGRFLLAASHLDRTSLLLAEVDWLRPSTGGFGNPASFHVPSMGRTLADPGCAEYEGLAQELTGGARSAASTTPRRSR